MKYFTKSFLHYQEESKSRTETFAHEQDVYSQLACNSGRKRLRPESI